MKFSLFALLLFCLSFSFCQNRSIDSIKNVMHHANGKDKVLSLLWLCWEYRFISADTARVYGFQALDLARAAKYDDYEAEALNHIGVTYEAQGNYRDALSFELQSFDIRKKLGDPNKLANSLNSLGIIFDEKGDYEKALNYYYEARKVYESIPDEGKIAMVLTNIGIVLRAQKDYKSAADHYKRAMHIYQKLANRFGLAACHSNLGKLYLNLSQYDSSIYYSLLASKEFEEQNVLQFLPTTFSNAGIAYDKKGDWLKSKEYFLKAKKLHQNYDNKKELSYTLSQLARLEVKLGNARGAITYGMEALDLANKIQALEQKMQAHESLAETNASLRNYEDAYKHHLQFAAVKDSLFEKEKSKQLQELQTKYETEKKDNQINLLNRENDVRAATIARNYWLMGVLALLVVMLGLSFIAWQKIQKQKQWAVAQEQKVRLREVQIKSIIDSQEHERKRFASDLHDGMGQLVTALQLNIQSIKSNQEFGKTVSLVENSEQLLADIQQEIRNIAFNLMPPILVKEGLIPAVRELARRVSRASSIKTDVIVHDFTNRFTDVVEIAVYRIIQELVSNVLKYSQATSLTLSFTGYDEEVVLTLEDDGIGYDLEKFKNSEYSNGWRTIQTRINLVRGEIEIDTQMGRKINTVIISIPLTNRIDRIEKLKQNT